jgi:hypothetical protein
MGAALLGGPAVLGWLAAGLAHPRVETQIADQPLRGGEPLKVPDRGHDRQGHGGIHARDGQQPADLGAFQADPAEFGVDDPQLLAVEVELAQQRPDRLVLVWGRSWVASQARPLVPNRSAAGQRPMRLRCRIDCTWFLQPGPLPHDVGAAGDLTA